MSVTSIHQCKNLKALLQYCLMPKAEQKKERVAQLYSDLGDSDQFLLYAQNTIKAHKRKVQGYSILQSFPKDEFSVADEAHIACANELGRKLAHELYPNSPCIVITHADSDGECVHNHIIVLNHDLQTNGCIRSNRHYKYVKRSNDRLMKKYGLEICQPSEQKQTQGEYWSNNRNGWFDELKESVDKALSYSTTMQEFQDCLVADGISPILYKANGTLKEHFTYKVTDSDGKEHKKRSDRLGEQYTRQAIEEKLLTNQRRNKPQLSVLSMSDWILLQQTKEQEKEEKPIPLERDEPIQSSVIFAVPQPVNTCQKEEEELEMQKEIIEQQKQLPRQLQKEAEYQKLLKERRNIRCQLEQLRKITENEDDVCMDEDYIKQDLLERKLAVIEFEMKRLKTERENGVPEEKLNERLMPKIATFAKDIGMSL